MRVHFRISEQVIDPLEQAVGNRVLQGFRFLMNLVPLHPQDFYEKQLDQSVSSQNYKGQFLTRLQQLDTYARDVLHMIGFRERLDH